MASAKRPSSSASGAVRLATRCASAGTGTFAGSPSGASASFQVFRAIFRFSSASWPARSVGLNSQNSSGSSWPCTIASPRPQAALISTTSGNPLSGSSVNMTPELARSEATIFWTAIDRATLR